MKKTFIPQLMLSGALAVLIYVLHVVLGGYLWKNYSHLQQPISDLTATGAPDRELLLPLTTLYGVLVLLFALSFTFLESKKHARLVTWGGTCFIFLHIISLIYGLFPEDLAGAPATFNGTMHIIITVLIVPFTILSPLLIGLGLSRETNWKPFARYSIATSAIILVMGALSGLFFAKKLPYFGLVERLNIGSLQLWTFVFSIKFFYGVRKKVPATRQQELSHTVV